MLPCPDRRSGICGAPWSRPSTLFLWCLFSSTLCRRWWNSCRTSCSSLPRIYRWFPSRSSLCRRSCLTKFLRDVCVATRSWRNSWWKCRRFSTSSNSGFPSRSTTIQFRMVVVELLEVFKAFSLDTVRLSGLRTRLLTFQLRAVVSGVFKVFSQNRVQLRLLLRLWNAFLSGLWSRSLFLRLVKAFKIFSQDRVHPLLLTIQLVVLKRWMSLGMGFFALFPNFKKARHNPRTRGQNCLRTRAHGRRLLMTRPWCLRRRRRRKMRSPRTSLSSLLSTCSTMGIGGVASGTQLISGIAGGWPLPMGHRPAIRYGGLHGSSAVGHGDVATMVLLGWCLVRQWIQVPASTYCGGASFLFIVKVVDTALFTETGTHSANLLCCSDVYPQCKLCR